jgi:hypothetical protein
MIFAEAVELEEGAELFLTDGVGRTLTDHVVQKVSGPHLNGTYANPVMLVSHSKDQKLTLHNLSDLVVKPPKPVQGETWFRRTDGASRYVEAVTEPYVILKHDRGRPDSKAYLMTISDFLKTFKKV